MAKLPTGLSGRDVCRALQQLGYSIDRQRGSHIVLYGGDPIKRLVVPNHREVRRGTLRQLIADAGLTVDEFLKLL